MHSTPTLPEQQKVVEEPASSAQRPTATTTTTNTTVRHRIEIVGAGSALSEEVRDAIRSAAPGKEISRIVDGATGQTIFAVGTFPEKADAEKVAEAIKSADGSLSTNIIELGK